VLSVTVTDAQGKPLQSNTSFNDGQVDLSGYEKGIYILTLQTEYGPVVKKVQVE
jgi:hypothetical protein